MVDFTVVATSEKGIVFFDGVCGLCNRLVDFLIRKDKKNVLLYAPLQGSTAAQYLPHLDKEDLSTVVYIFAGKTYTRSDAILQILVHIGGFWKVAGVFKIIPRALRNSVYSFIAKRRYKWFGKRDTCRLPAPEERARFLD